MRGPGPGKNDKELILVVESRSRKRERQGRWSYHRGSVGVPGAGVKTDHKRGEELLREEREGVVGREVGRGRQ